MEETVLNILFVIIIIIVIMQYLFELLLNDDSSYQKKRHKKKIFEDANFKYDLYNGGVIKDVKNYVTIDIPEFYNNTIINCIDIDRNIVCETFIIGKNINHIKQLKLKCEKVISNSPNYTIKDDAIFDKYNNLIVIFKEKTKEELFNYAKNYSIGKQALFYFSNALYNQFVLYERLYDLRFSKPYTEKNEELYAIIPSRINGIMVESISINYANVKYMFIPSTVKRVIIEKKSEFNHLIIDNSNPNLIIFNNTLLQKNTGLFVNDKINTFNLINTENKKDFKSNYKLFNRKYLLFNKYKYTYSVLQVICNKN